MVVVQNSVDGITRMFLVNYMIAYMITWHPERKKYLPTLFFVDVSDRVHHRYLAVSLLYATILLTVKPLI